MTTELISILIPTYNRSHCLRELLSRLTNMFGHELAQRSLEILVFNDASTDDTKQVCDSYGDKIRYLSTSHNLASLEGRRRMMAAAQGTYLVSLDDDSCLLDKEALNQIRAGFAVYPNCAAIAANVATPKTPGGQAPVVDISPLTVNSFIACGVAFQTELVKRVGGYPNFLSTYMTEEAVLALRILDAGYEIRFLPTLRVYHAEDQVTRSFIKQRTYKFVNDLALVIYAYPLWLIMPAFIKKIMSHIVYDAKHQSLAAISLAAGMLPKALHRAIIHRKPVRIQTLKQYYALRRDFAAQHQRWQLAGKVQNRWTETETMFVGGNF